MRELGSPPSIKSLKKIRLSMLNGLLKVENLCMSNVRSHLNPSYLKMKLLRITFKVELVIDSAGNMPNVTGCDRHELSEISVIAHLNDVYISPSRIISARVCAFRCVFTIRIISLQCALG